MAMEDPMGSGVTGLSLSELLEKSRADDSKTVAALITVAEGMALVLMPDVVEGMTPQGAKILADALRTAANRIESFSAARPQG